MRVNTTSQTGLLRKYEGARPAQFACRGDWVAAVAGKADLPCALELGDVVSQSASPAPACFAWFCPLKHCCSSYSSPAASSSLTADIVMASKRYWANSSDMSPPSQKLTMGSLQQKQHEGAQYIPVSRDRSHGSPSTNNYTGLSPMERWQVESSRDQPWHALSAVQGSSHPSTKKTKAKQGSSHKASAGSKP
ncbi:uncharacterized protein PG986_007866 [Apiospora aurea]|uniref:Uncharacterized protein n=1 Tax=Apiospora aurea TaxID=335848 RepID=A0ABR1QDS1_9PEZI